MSKLSNLTDKQIHEAIEAMQNGIAIKPNSEEAEALQVSINRAYAELERRAQKKSESQPTGNPEQLPIPKTYWESEQNQPPMQYTRQQAENPGYTMEEKQAQSQHPDSVQSEQAFNLQENRVIVGRASDVVVTVPVAEVLVGGNIKVLTQTEILGYLKTYFKGVATGAKMQEGKYSEAYAGEMGKTVYRLFDAWNLIYKQTNEGAAWPPLVDCFAGLKNAKHNDKVRADILWRWASRGNA